MTADTLRAHLLGMAEAARAVFTELAPAPTKT
jgi:hypothetical protein